ncbi:MAG: CapA family protein [Agathobacter sp.]|nr:CapA family protein [Agathobacter sp.]
MEDKKAARKKARKKQIYQRVLLATSVIIVTVIIILAVMGNDKQEFADKKEDVTQENQLTENNTENLEMETQSVVKDFTMFFTGDIMLENVISKYDSQGINGILSTYLQDEMVNADMTVINHEFPFSTRGEKAPDKQFTFRVNPTYVTALQDMGVDVASLANNHALDFGQDALLDTFTTLDDAGIPYVGAGETKERAEEAIYVEANGRTVGVLSASRVIPVHTWNITSSQPGLFCTYDSTRLIERIQEIEDKCDFVVVFVHWGLERKTYPEEYQRELAKQYIDAGADLVVGNHAHVPQGIEYYKGVPIVYCLGNYIFNPNMVDTYALKVVWDTENHTQLQVIPIDTKELLTSELNDQEAAEFYAYLESISFGISIDEAGMVTNTAENTISE